MSIFARTIIILPILVVLVLVALFFYPFAEPLLELGQESEAVGNTWGDPGDTVVRYFSLAIAAFGIGLFAWHIFAPIRDDVHRRRF